MNKTVNVKLTEKEEKAIATVVAFFQGLKDGKKEDEENRIMTKQEMMVKKAVLYPFNVDELIEENAGIATVLSEEILAKSGFAISYTEEL